MIGIYYVVYKWDMRRYQIKRSWKEEHKNMIFNKKLVSFKFYDDPQSKFIRDPHFLVDPDPGKKSSCGSWEFFQMILKNFLKNWKRIYENFSAQNCLKRMINTQKTYVTFFPWCKNYSSFFFSFQGKNILWS